MTKTSMTPRQALNIYEEASFVETLCTGKEHEGLQEANDVLNNLVLDSENIPTLEQLGYELKMQGQIDDVKYIVYEQGDVNIIIQQYLNNDNFYMRDVVKERNHRDPLALTFEELLAVAEIIKRLRRENDL